VPYVGCNDALVAALTKKGELRHRKPAARNKAMQVGLCERIYFFQVHYFQNVSNSQGWRLGRRPFGRMPGMPARPRIDALAGANIGKSGSR
jgi:hypothetical protein